MAAKTLILGNKGGYVTKSNFMFFGSPAPSNKTISESKVNLTSDNQFRYSYPAHMTSGKHYSGTALEFDYTYTASDNLFIQTKKHLQIIGAQQQTTYEPYDLITVDTAGESGDFSFTVPQWWDSNHTKRVDGVIVEGWLGHYGGAVADRYYGNLFSVSLQASNFKVRFFNGSSAYANGYIIEGSVPIVVFNSGTYTAGTSMDGMMVLTVSLIGLTSYANIDFDPNGGTWTGTAPSQKHVFAGEEFGDIFPTFSEVGKTGFGLTGWFDGNGTRYTEDSTVATSSTFGDMVLYAGWGGPRYLYLDANGGYLPDADQHKTVYQGSLYGAYGALPTPRRTGYVFDGWYTDPVNGTKIEDGTTVNISTGE